MVASRRWICRSFHVIASCQSHPRLSLSEISFDVRKKVDSLYWQTLERQACVCFLIPLPFVWLVFLVYFSVSCMDMCGRVHRVCLCARCVPRLVVWLYLSQPESPAVARRKNTCASRLSLCLLYV